MNDWIRYVWCFESLLKKANHFQIRAALRKLVINRHGQDKTVFYYYYYYYYVWAQLMAELFI